jgi:hypothetical protein
MNDATDDTQRMYDALAAVGESYGSVAKHFPPTTRPLTQQARAESAEARVEFITDELADRNPDALTADGFDAALIGYTVNSCEPTRAIYSVARCLEVLQASGMTADEAEEYFWFNTAGAYVGVNGPLFIECPGEEE